MELYYFVHFIHWKVQSTRKSKSRRFDKEVSSNYFLFFLFQSTRPFYLLCIPSRNAGLSLAFFFLKDVVEALHFFKQFLFWDFFGITILQIWLNFLGEVREGLSSARVLKIRSRRCFSNFSTCHLPYSIDNICNFIFSRLQTIHIYDRHEIFHHELPNGIRQHWNIRWQWLYLEWSHINKN